MVQISWGEDKNELRNEKSEPVVLARKRKNIDGSKSSAKLRAVVRRGIVNWAPPATEGEDEASCKAHVTWMKKATKPIRCRQENGIDVFISTKNDQ